MFKDEKASSIDKSDSYLNNNIEDDLIENDILQMFGENANKQEVFDRFLTYRRRMARLAAVQALYLYDFRTKVHNLKKIDIFNADNGIVNVNELCQDVIYFYKNIRDNRNEKINYS